MAEKTRIISANDMHVLMTQCLDAAKEIHIAMCLFDDDHYAQRNLGDAMHAVLVGATQCMHLHRSEKFRLATTEDEEAEGHTPSLTQPGQDAEAK